MILTTERLILRPLKYGDFDAVHSYASVTENVKYMSWGPNNEEDTRDFICGAIEEWKKEPQSKFDFAVTLKTTGKLIGACGIYLNDVRIEAEVGWILHRDYWKQGYGSEFAKALVKFGFEDLNLHRICAFCNAENYGSYRVMENAGMRREAHFIKNRYGRVGSEKMWYDTFVYAILREEWVK